MVRVDAAGGVVVRRTVERMHIEAALGNHAVWVGHVIGIADEELEVTLVCVRTRDNNMNGGREVRERAQSKRLAVPLGVHDGTVFERIQTTESPEAAAACAGALHGADQRAMANSLYQRQ